MYTFYGYKDSKVWDIHHIDKNPLNNSLNNLVYLTHKEHISLHHKGKVLSKETKQKMSESHKIKHHTEEAKQPEETKHLDLTSKQVKIISYLLEGANIFKSQSLLAKELGVSRPTIKYCIDLLENLYEEKTK